MWKRENGMDQRRAATASGASPANGGAIPAQSMPAVAVEHSRVRTFETPDTVEDWKKEQRIVSTRAAKLEGRLAVLKDKRATSPAMVARKAFRTEKLEKEIQLLRSLENFYDESVTELMTDAQEEMEMERTSSGN